MSDENELTAWCSKYPWFHGVFASDELPEPSALPPGAAVIVNYIDRDAGKTGHWCAILHVGDKQQRPAFFDSFAFQPDGLDQILQTRTRFEPWIKKASQLAGHHGEYDYNHESLQCVTTDSCGHYACWAIKVNCLPQTEDGVLRHAWLPVWDGRSGCEHAERNIRRLVRLEK